MQISASQMDPRRRGFVETYHKKFSSNGALAVLSYFTYSLGGTSLLSVIYFSMMTQMHCDFEPMSLTIM